MIKSVMTPKGEIEIGDYVLCDMEYEGPKWVKVYEFHENMEAATGVAHEDEWGSTPGWDRFESALSGKVVLDLDSGEPTQVSDMCMCFPASSVMKRQKLPPSATL